jgi:hypothetical protein
MDAGSMKQRAQGRHRRRKLGFGFIFAARRVVDSLNGARETGRRRRAWRFAFTALSRLRLGEGLRGPFACLTFSMLGIMMLHIWSQGASSIRFHLLLVPSSLLHPVYYG